MDIKELEKNILAAVERYIADEETYDDNAQIQIDPETGKVTVVDSDEAESDSPVAPDENIGDDNEGRQISPEIPGMDYIDVMELISMSPDQPGKWIPDTEAIHDLAEQYK